MKETGIVFNIQKFSIHDGPGVRTTVFLKGCPLRCRWCANPESQSARIQVLYDEKKCVHCGKCVKICPKQAISMDDAGHIHINRQSCTACLQCCKTCPRQALTQTGEEKTVDEVFRVCMQDLPFYEESGGGVTISGGEGMVQPNFVEALILRLKEKQIHTAIETTGGVSAEVFRRLAPLFDLLLFDVKHWDSAAHKSGTGVGNERIVENLRWAVEQNLNILPRIPVIPGFNDTISDAKGLAALLSELGLNRVQLLPFHQMGERKYEFLDREYGLTGVNPLHREELEDYRRCFLDTGVEAYF